MADFPLPAVLRARDFHLYLENGKRLTDLWLFGGRAVLGHKPPGMLREMKNAAERGLFSPFPHPAEKRFVKALGMFFPGRIFRIYADEGSLFRALAEAGFTGGGNPTAGNVSGDNLSCAGGRKKFALFPDPAFPSGEAEATGKTETGEKSVLLWRPFLETRKALAAGTKSGVGASVALSGGDDSGKVKAGAVPSGSVVGDGGNDAVTAAPVLIPVLPFPLGPAVLVLDKNTEAFFPPGERIPPVLLAPATRALYDLAAAMKAPPPNRGRPRFPHVEKALARQKSGGKTETGKPGVLWRRRGIYLTVGPETDRETYDELFRNFLEGGFLIPPSPQEPAILPASMSKGEESKLAQLLAGGVCPE